MSNTKISGLPVAAALTGAEPIPAVQGGATVKTTAQAIANLIPVTGRREILTASRTYFVRTDGSNSNTGLVNNAGGAFLTIQHAFDVITQTLDFGGTTNGTNTGHVVTVQVNTGTYNEGPVVGVLTGVSISKVGFTLPLKLIGDTVTPGNVVINGVLKVKGPGSYLQVSGVNVQSILGDFYAVISNDGKIEISNGAGIEVDNFADFLSNSASITYTQSAYASTMSANNYGKITIETATINYQVGTVVSANNLIVRNHGTITFTPALVTGTIIGSQCSAINFGHIETAGGGISSLPGDVLGVIETQNFGLVSPSTTNIREVLLSDRIYFVRQDGSDSNNGLTNNATGAFLTIQHAVNIISTTIDFGGWLDPNSSPFAPNTITIRVDTGSYSEFVTISNLTGAANNTDQFVGFDQCPLKIIGDVVTPSNVKIGFGVGAAGATALIGLDGIQTPLLFGFNYSLIGIGSNVILDAATSTPIQCGEFACISALPAFPTTSINLTIKGNMTNMLRCDTGGHVVIVPTTLNFDIAAISSGPVQVVNRKGMVEFIPGTITGTVIGSKFDVKTYGFIRGTVAALPGTIAGTVDATSFGFVGNP